MSVAMQRIEERMSEIARRIEQVEAEIRRDQRYEQEDVEAAVIEVFDQIGERLDHLLTRVNR